MELTLLRHGESEGVERGILQGRLDLPLTARGRQEIRALAQAWRAAGLQYERIVTSPLLRARQTADIAAGVLGGPEPVDEPLWLERNFGAGEGQDLALIERWYAGRPRPTPFEPLYDSGESEWDAHLRAGQAVGALLAEPAGRVLVISHGNILQTALHVIFSLLPSGRAVPVELALLPARCARLRYNAETGRWSLLSFNEGMSSS